MKFATLGVALATTGYALAQNDTNNLHLPSMHPCIPGYSYGTDSVIFTTPYTYNQVLSIIGSFRNITWSGSPYGTVTLNGTDNTVGTARTYDIVGAHVIETITLYQKPQYPGPYDEVHTLLPLTIPSVNNVSFYGDYDGTTVNPTCGGAASVFNFTINFCANNATLAAATLHSIHLTDAQTVGKFLGGQNFTSCGAIVYGKGGSNFTGGNGTATSGNGPTPTQTPVPFTGDAGIAQASFWTVVGAVVILLL